MEIADNDTTCSPTFAGFVETLEGIVTVRAFSAQPLALLPVVEKHDHPSAASERVKLANDYLDIGTATTVIRTMRRS